MKYPFLAFFERRSDGVGLVLPNEGDDPIVGIVHGQSDLIARISPDGVMRYRVATLTDDENEWMLLERTTEPAVSAPPEPHSSTYGTLQVKNDLRAEKVVRIVRKGREPSELVAQPLAWGDLVLVALLDHSRSGRDGVIVIRFSDLISILNGARSTFFFSAAAARLPNLENYHSLQTREQVRRFFEDNGGDPNLIR